MDLAEATAKCAGRAVEMAAGGLPVGPFVEELVRDILHVQDQQMLLLESISADIHRLLGQHRRVARELLERAALPGRTPDAVAADLRDAAEAFAYAASVERDDSIERAAIHFDAALVQLLLGDAPAARFYVEKSWREGFAALSSAVRIVCGAMELNPGLLEFLLGTSRDDRNERAIMNGDCMPTAIAWKQRPVRGIMTAHFLSGQVNQFHDGWMVLEPQAAFHWPLGFVDVGPSHMGQPVRLVKAYLIEQLQIIAAQTRELAQECGIDERLYAFKDPRWPDFTGTLMFEQTGLGDDRARRFEDGFKRAFPLGIVIGLSISESRRRGLSLDVEPIW
jgi:hypothetical protein